MNKSNSVTMSMSSRPPGPGDWRPWGLRVDRRVQNGIKADAALAGVTMRVRLHGILVEYLRGRGLWPDDAGDGDAADALQQGRPRVDRGPGPPVL